MPARLLLLVLALGLAGCATSPPPAKDAGSGPTGPVLYGKVIGAVDHVWGH